MLEAAQTEVFLLTIAELFPPSIKWCNKNNDGGNSMITFDFVEMVYLINTYVLVLSGAYLCITIPLYLLGFFYKRLWNKILGVPAFSWVGFLGSFIIVIQCVTISAH